MSTNVPKMIEHLPEYSYVGMTQTTLSRRITTHLYSGAPKKHTAEKHTNTNFDRDMMVENTKILRKENDYRRLQIYEALIIHEKRPLINKQDTGFNRTLKLFGPNPSTTRHISMNSETENSLSPLQ